MKMRLILILSLFLSACAFCGEPLITITGGGSSGGSFDPGATNAVLESAILYADTIATDAFFEACIYAGSVAGDAERNSKAYSDTNLNTAKAYSDANLVTAKGYSDSNLATAKGYSDDNLRSAKGYSDGNLITAKGYADNASTTKSDSALFNAKIYSDTNTLVRAKAYSDSDLIIAKGYSDNNLISAKGYADGILNLAQAYSDNNLISAKGYSDNNLIASKGYSDANYIASKVYSDTNTLARAEDFSLDVLDYSKTYSNTNTLVLAKSYADTKLSRSGGFMSGDLNMNTHSVIGVANPVNGQDAATKTYVDDTYFHAKLYSDTNTLARARSYSDTDLNLAKGYSDSNLNTAKGYSDGNLLTAKGYSDANLVTAKGYSDNNFIAAKTYSDTNTLVRAKSYADSLVSDWTSGACISDELVGHSIYPNTYNAVDYDGGLDSGFYIFSLHHPSVHCLCTFQILPPSGQTSTDVQVSASGPATSGGVFSSSSYELTFTSASGGQREFFLVVTCMPFEGTSDTSSRVIIFHLVHTFPVVEYI